MEYFIIQYKILHNPVLFANFIPAASPRRVLDYFVREGGVEPPHPKALDPKSSASAISATLAQIIDVNIKIFIFKVNKFLFAL